MPKDPTVGGFSLQLGQGNAQNTRRKVKITEEEENRNQELVTSFGESGLVSAAIPASSHLSGPSHPRVIPNQGNDIRGLGGRKSKKARFVPQAGDIQRIENGADRFETAAQDEVKTSVQYGLNLMRETAPAEQLAVKQEQDDSSAPAGSSRRGKQVVRSRDWEGEAFKRDMHALPDQLTVDQYEQMPVDMFGEAMLRGMGWQGPDANTAAAAVNFVRRPQGLGLGATPAMPTHDKKGEKGSKHQGRQKEPRKDLVVYDKNGRIKHTMREGDKLVERRKLGPSEGKWMRVLTGRHEGLKCKVLAINPKREGRSQTADVRLHPSEETVSVRLKELGEVDQKPERQEDGDGTLSRAPADLEHETKQRAQKGNRDSGAHRDQQGASHKSNGAGREDLRGDLEPNGHAEPIWFAPHIRVKVIDKALGRGRYYLKKGEITDVMSSELCSLHLDSGDRLDVTQDQIETSIPRAEGARVLILLGPHRRKRAKMLQKNSEKSQAALQLTEDYSVVKCSFDEFAEYVGPLGEEE